ncbi:MAG: ABC transporter permease subunit [Nitrososphaerota archaeon]|nr:ABC transporter permease subunit [Nitrososphaerota archaeon]MDG6940065.1 ABC transporter permease subunit [Nitrososphaerota archaeon]
MLFLDPFIARIIDNTLIYTVAVPLVDIALAIPLAVALKRTKKSWMLFLMLLPSFIPYVTAAVAWALALNPFYGVTYYFLRTNLFVTVWFVVLVDVWESLPLATLVIYSGLKSIPSQIDEATQVDGLVGMKRMLQVDLPYALPYVLTSLVLMLIFAIFTFDPIYVTQGEVAPLANVDLAFYAYQQFFGGQPGYAAVLIVLMSVISTALSLAFVRFTTSRGVRRLPVPRWVPNRETPSAVHWAVLSFFLFFFLAPLAWLVLESLKVPAAIYAIPPQIIPDPATLVHYVNAVVSGLPYLLSSVVVAAGVLVLTVLLGSPAAYAMARYGFGGTKLLAYVLFVYSLPSLIFMIPLYGLVNFLGLINTWWGQIVTFPVFVLPVVMWMMYNAYSNFPQHVDEAAQMDGLSRVRAFFRIVLPLSADGIGVAALYSFLISWGALIFPLVLTYSPFNMNLAYPSGAQTFSIFIGGTLGHESVHYGQLAAAAIISVLPPSLLLYFTRERLERMWRSGGVKG